MDEIDRSKAPKGATHYLECEDGSILWRKQFGDSWCAPIFGNWELIANPAQERYVELRASDAPQNDESQNVARIEWDGVGTPAVGVVCEYDARPIGKGDPLWVTVRINYLSEWTVVYTCVGVPDGANKENIGVELANCPGPNLRFRPIRTPEQIAAEERTRAIDELVKVTCINRGEAGRIYDAGWRKQVTQ